MVKYVTAKEGYEFALTTSGLEQNKVRAKFDKDSKLYKQYSCSVPESWLEKGWVQLVKKEGEQVKLCT